MPDLPDVQPLDITPSRRGWQIEIYREHLEEAAALWEQRPADRENPDLTWPDLGDDEARLEAHLDALVLGGDLALAVCRQQALDGDPGELHAALRVFCRHQRGDLVGAALEGVDPDAADALDALCEALAAEMPADWLPGALRADLLADPRRLRLAADLAAHRRLPGAALLAALPTAPAGVRASVVRALGRSADGPPLSALTPLLTDADEGVRLEAGLALLRSGAPQAATAVLTAVRTDPALVPLLALAGRETAIPWLLDVLAHPPAAAAAARALGLLGDPAAVPALVAALVGDAAPDAARALTLLTGAALTDETFVEDVPDDDERFEDEPPPLPGQAPRGTTVVEPCTDPARWGAWWEAHRAAFEGAERFRLGLPAGPAALVASLAAPDMPHGLRVWIAEELVVRHRLPVPFETTWSVARQRAALDAMQAWAQSEPAVAGRWYVGGHYVGGA
jgi:uncharacterized protein (TIGR02270 family)